MASVVAPWTLRNYRELGEFVLVSTNGGVVLYSANNPYTDGRGSAVHLPPAENEGASRVGLRRAAAQDGFKATPPRFLGLAVNRACITWGTSTQIMPVVSIN